jgi:hypothetical protein
MTTKITAGNVELDTLPINILSDVDTVTVTPTSGQALVWDVSSSKWVPGTISGGGGSLTIKEENTNLTTAATSINFVGQGITANTSGNDVTVTVGNRVITITDGYSITIDSNITDIAYQLNTQVTNILTIAAPTGTPINGQKLILKVKCTNTQTFSWNQIFTGSVDQSLPIATSGNSKYDYMGFIYDSDAIKWQLVARNFGF